MKFKELFSKQFLVEEHVRKSLKVFYEINMELFKPQGGETDTPTEPTVQPQQDQAPAPQQPMDNNPAPVAQPVDNTAPTPEAQPEATPQPSSEVSSMAGAFSSVYTEDERVMEQNDAKIVRKMQGELELTDGQKDNIQTLDDIISVLSETKKDGIEILDQFSAEIIQLFSAGKAEELKNKIDKKSKVYVEIFYGYKKDDSIGVKFVKRPNLDSITTTMFIDNEIVSARFSVDKVNTKIAEFRNYYVNSAHKST